MGIQYEIIKKSGAWFSYNDEKIAQGRDKARDYLKANPEIAKEVEEKIVAAVKEKKNKAN